MGMARTAAAILSKGASSINASVAMPLSCTVEQRDCIRACLAGKSSTTWTDAAIIQCGQFTVASATVGTALGGLVGLCVDVVSHGATCGCGTVKGAGAGAAAGGSLGSAYCGIEFASVAGLGLSKGEPVSAVPCMGRRR